MQMMNWSQAIAELSSQDKTFVIVTILSVEGSAPRQAGTKMVVDQDRCFDSIGGGNLEHSAISLARELIHSGQSMVMKKSFTLGSDLTQCCGGKVELLLECIAAHHFDIVVFGAGHVGKALIKILSELHCRVHWIDPRKQVVDHIDIPPHSNVTLTTMNNPDMDVEQCPKNAYYLVMTHSHELDMQLVEAILSRNDIRFCGLIGSKSKAAKFRNRLGRKQFSEDRIGRLTCPIGLPEIQGNSPMEVALSVAAQIISLNNDKAQRTVSSVESKPHTDTLIRSI